MNDGPTNKPNGGRVLITALIVTGAFLIVSVLVCGALGVMFLNNPPWP